MDIKKALFDSLEEERATSLISWYACPVGHGNTLLLDGASTGARTFQLALFSLSSDNGFSGVKDAIEFWRLLRSQAISGQTFPQLSLKQTDIDTYQCSSVFFQKRNVYLDKD